MKVMRKNSKNPFERKQKGAVTTLCDMRNLLAPICIFLFFLSCGNNDKNDEIEVNLLEGTTWKLAGFINNETGFLTKPTPVDCGDCFRILFAENSTLRGRAVSNGFGGTYKADFKTYDFRIIEFNSTHVGELGHGWNYKEALIEVHSFYQQEDELRLYYNDNRRYLLFKPFEQ